MFRIVKSLRVQVRLSGLERGRWGLSPALVGPWLCAA